MDYEKSLDELFDDLVSVAEVGSPRHEQIKMAAQAKMVEQLARPQRWAAIAATAAVVSAICATVSLVA